MAQRRLAGTQEPIEVRRVGFRHAVVTPARQASLVDMNRIRVQHDEATAQVVRLEAQLGKARANRDQLRDFLAQFDAQPIDRVEGDPPVPLEAPVADPPAPRGGPAEPGPEPPAPGRG